MTDYNPVKLTVDGTMTERVDTSKPNRSQRPRELKQKSVKIDARFSAANKDPFDTVEWELRTAEIINPQTGETVFREEGLEFPTTWSENCTALVAEKYFRHVEYEYTNGVTTIRKRKETSVKQMITRVADTITRWGVELGFFTEGPNAAVFNRELRYILLHQMAAFNSPVWFNVGTKRGVMREEQASACFIVSVEDTMDSILELAQKEGALYKGGSGSGVNYSPLRSSREKLSIGGTSSGPVPFIAKDDFNAGAIKSGGGCLAPWQRVYTARGPVPVKELATSGEDFVAVSYDPPSGRYKAKTARAWYAGDKDVYKITTDKGEFFLTEDHPVRLSSDVFVKAGELKPGMSLFSCSIDWGNGGYPRVHLRDGKKGKELLHRLVAKDVMSADIEGLPVHHKDEDKTNNSPSNLEVLSQSKHASLHGQELVAQGAHVFQRESFDHSGRANGMHQSSSFWKDEEKSSAYREKQGKILKGSGRSAEMQQLSAAQKMMNTAFKVLNAGHSIDTFEDYVAGRKEVIGRIPSVTKLELSILQRFGSYDQFVAEVGDNNHRVVAVEKMDKIDVYDVEVDCPTPDDKSPQTGHNFVIWTNDDFTGRGVVVANTRRAAKMAILNADHGDIFEFVTCKAHSEKAAHALIDAGFDGDFRARWGAYQMVPFQNANHSVRVTDEFMRAVEEDGVWSLRARDGSVLESVPARDLYDEICKAAHFCGDPGIQFDTTINNWHTCPESGRINSSNPCCFVGETLVETSEGRIRIDELQRMSDAGEELPLAFAWDEETDLPVLRQINKAWQAGNSNAFVEVKTDKGVTLRCTPEHRFLLRNGEWVSARYLKPGDRLRKIGRWANEQRSNRWHINHKATPSAPNGTVIQARWMWEQAHGPVPPGMHVHHKNEDPTDDRLSNLELEDRLEHITEHSKGPNNARFMELRPEVLVEVYEAVEAIPRKTHKSAPPVTPVRWNAYIKSNGLSGKVPLAGSPTYGGRIQGMAWAQFEEFIEEHRGDVNDYVVEAADVTVTCAGRAVYDIEVAGVHNFSVACEDADHGIIVHNSEYMFLDDTACNLASINLVKFQDEYGSLDTDRFRHTVDVLVTAMEILVDGASYPTQQIQDNSSAFRPLGLGYTNLGAFFMRQGISYDSDEARAQCGFITSLMTARAYRQSAKLADTVGPFPGYADNETAMLQVMCNHRNANENLRRPDLASAHTVELYKAASEDWNDVIDLGDVHGYRNSQATVLAPTGTISFLMDCDTTGIEPVLNLVMYKKLVGGGTIKLVNHRVGEALDALDYSPKAIEAIEAYILAHGSVVGSGVDEEHYHVFDGAFPDPVGGRYLRPEAHILMMSAAQPFLSGAISKTCNIPGDATEQDIADLYMLAWKSGLKSVALYRDGSKRTQPLQNSDEDKTVVLTEQAPVRRKLPRECMSLRHKFEIGAHEGYIHVGMYEEDGTPGEIFIKMAKEGSTVSGLMDAWGIQTSMSLQYGVPIEQIVDKFKYTSFEPSGWTSEPGIGHARSILDYVARWLEMRFVNSPTAGIADAPTIPEAVAPELSESTTTGIICPSCGHTTQRTGACATCTVCGWNQGCG